MWCTCHIKNIYAGVAQALYMYYVSIVHYYIYPGDARTVHYCFTTILPMHFTTLPWRSPDMKCSAHGKAPISVSFTPT